MPKGGIRWTRPPSELAKAVDQYGDRVREAIAGIAQYCATEMQNQAKNDAGWTDRTGNARTGIFGTSEADWAAHVVTIYLSHGAVIDYGVWLELAHGGNYAVIMRTMESKYDEVMSRVKAVLG